MANKIFDVVVKTGSYQANGETKNRYENIGVVMDNGDGPFLLLKRTFNPAGVPDLKGDNSDMLLVSLFAPNNDQNKPQQNNQQQPQQNQPQSNFNNPPPQNQGGFRS